MTDDDGFDRRRVLLVEDEAMSRTLLHGLLTTAGFEVESCTGAAEAMDLVSWFDPDVVVTDIDLGGGLSGLDLVVAMTKRAPYVAVVILSNYAITADYRQAGLGRAVYLNKSELTDGAVLIDAVEGALAEAPQREASSAGAGGRLAGLTVLQVQVLRMMAEGLSNEEIARRRGASVKSVEHMISRIFTALGLVPDGATNLRVAAVRRYVEEAGLPAAPRGDGGGAWGSGT